MGSFRCAGLHRGQVDGEAAPAARGCIEREDGWEASAARGYIEGRSTGSFRCAGLPRKRGELGGELPLRGAA